MSNYSLSITPSRGWVWLDSSRFDSSTFAYVPTSITGNKFPSGQAGRFGPLGQVRSQIFSSETNLNNLVPNAIYFNNSNLTLATQCRINQSGFSYVTSGSNDYFIMYKFPATNNWPGQFVFRITGQNTNTQIMNIQFYSSNGIGIPYGETVFWERGFGQSPLLPPVYAGSPSTPLVITGEKETINTIMQTPSLINWTDYPTGSSPNISATPGAGPFGLVNLIYTQRTDDVILSYVLTKDGVSYPPYATRIKYKNPNPNNYT